MFNATNPTQNGVIFANYWIEEGRYVSNLLPITNSSYGVLGFSTTQRLTSKRWAPLLRFDYLNTANQFEYRLNSPSDEVTCYQLLYIEYSYLFAASLSSSNGVLLYDISMPVKTPKRVFHVVNRSYTGLAYLESSKVLLMGEADPGNLYGYSLIGQTAYHLRTEMRIRRLVAFKSSDYFLIIPREETKFLAVYNLEGLVHVMEFKQNSNFSGLIYSEFFGGIFSMEDNLLIRYSSSPQTTNPSCNSNAQLVKNKKTSYSFSNAWCGKECSHEAKFTQRGVCELSN